MRAPKFPRWNMCGAKAEPPASEPRCSSCSRKERVDDDIRLRKAAGRRMEPLNNKAAQDRRICARHAVTTLRNIARIE